jgi:hypothetical protein
VLLLEQTTVLLRYLHVGTVCDCCWLLLGQCVAHSLSLTAVTISTCRAYASMLVCCLLVAVLTPARSVLHGAAAVLLMAG